MSAAALARLDASRARRLTDQLRDTLELAVDLLGQAYRGEAWRALGYGSWSAYCAEELPQLRLLVRGLPPEERRPRVAELRRDGMSLRAVADATGLAPNTVKADAEAEGVQLAQVIRLSDGARVAATSSAPARRRRDPLTARVAAAVAAAGPGGVTAREVARSLRVSQHLVAPALVRLARRGRIRYVAPPRRGLFGRYVLGTVA